jgi:hypothetical protein
MSVYTIYKQGMETRVIGYIENTHKYMKFVELACAYDEKKAGMVN